MADIGRRTGPTPARASARIGVPAGPQTHAHFFCEIVVLLWMMFPGASTFRMMTDYTQDNRLFKVHCESLGPNDLLLDSFSGVERVSDSFSYEVKLFSQNDSWDPNQILGKNLSIEVGIGEKKRFFSGIVSRFSQAGAREPLAAYVAEIVPWTWLLGLKRNCRIFQEKSVQDIVETVLKETSTDFTFELAGTYEPRTYCVQYNESDLAFISRLLEDEGIFYYFDHEKLKHTMVLSDDSPGAKGCPGQWDLRLVRQAGAWQEENVVLSAVLEASLHAGKVALRDFDFEKPDDTLEVETPTVSEIPDLKNYEVYEYPGGYVQSQKGKKRADLAIAQLEAGERILTGTGDVRALQTGYKMLLSEHPSPAVDGTYFILEVQHFGQNAWEEETRKGDYQNSFSAIPADVKFRPPRKTPRPIVAGLQTAKVVGPKNSELFTDKYGRVKVQFPWDRQGKLDDKSSCWIRVSTSWAGGTWGAVHLPRVGWEVVISFLDGDPDRPVITGCLYNANQMPPYTLPDNQSQSGIKSRSLDKGNDKTFNELRFEDKKDEEEVYLHAERDLTGMVENTESWTVDGKRVFLIKGEGKDGVEEVADKLTIKEGDQHVTLEKGNMKVTLDKGNMKVTLDKGNQTLLLKKGSQKITIFKDKTTELKTGNLETRVKAGKVTVEAMQEMLFKVGGSSIKLTPTDITIKGVMLKITGDAKADIKSLMTTVNGDGMLTLKGGLTKIN